MQMSMEEVTEQQNGDMAAIKSSSAILALQTKVNILCTQRIFNKRALE